MRTARCGAVLSVLVGVLSWAPLPLHAQTSTTGAIGGLVTEAGSGAPLAGATAVATSPALQGTQAAMTDDAGRYRITGLPPGNYLVTFHYGSALIERRGVTVPLGQVTRVDQRIDLAAASGEVIEVRGEGSAIDPTSNRLGSRVRQEQLRGAPVPGRTFGTALGSAAGSQSDGAGVAFSGATSLENHYVVDGVNTTSLTDGTIGTSLMNEFIEEIQVVTGGYQAEYGRATGAVVNVVTKQGSNELHGSAFATVVPYQVQRTPVRQVQTSIDGTTDLDYSADFGVDLGGPIVRDRVWFYVGFAPQLEQSTVTRRVRRRMDCHLLLPDGSLSACDADAYGDGAPDEDPRTGELLFEEVDRREYRTVQQAFQWVSKINVALSPEQQGQFSLIGTPLLGQGALGVSGAESATRAQYFGLTTDLAGKWTSKLEDGRTEIEALAGWHRDKYDQEAFDASVRDTPTTRAFFFDLGRLGVAGRESQEAIDGCRDSAAGGDPYPQIENCPLSQYWLDSPGFTVDRLEDRRSGAARLTRRFDGGGHHIVKVGADLEDNRLENVRHYSGGRLYQLLAGGHDQVRVFRYVAAGAAGGGDLCGFEPGEDGAPDPARPRSCDYLDRAPATGRTVNWAAFAQDSWQPVPYLTVNAGVRYEEQRLRHAEEIRGTTDPFTMERIDAAALTLRNMWAPRLGVVVDPTREGRSRLHASVGRYYESIPMALNDFSFSGITTYGAFFAWDQCRGDTGSPDSSGQAPSPRDCPEVVDAASSPQAGEIYRGGSTVVAPGTRAQHMDELILGGEVELAADLALGASYRARRLGRVLEDVSLDGGESYVLGNPGFGTLGGFDRPRRDHHALEVTALKRVARGFFVQGSYTYARTHGNYPGLYNHDTGDARPNASSQYDLPELLANRDGPLPQDRPHYLKLDGFYTFDFEAEGRLTAGIRLRALSGTPVDTLGAHHRASFGESYLLPRGSGGRTPTVTGTDVHLGYARELGRGTELSAFVDVINFFNQEQVFLLDEQYTFDNVKPIVDGEPEDLVWAKAQDASGAETSQPITRNVGHGTPLSRYVPLYLRVGVRLTF